MVTIEADDLLAARAQARELLAHPDSLDWIEEHPDEHGWLSGVKLAEEKEKWNEQNTRTNLFGSHGNHD
ncbi:MAG: hypothetical protein LAO04_16755 [Acidobacteriia bacterium]|nr:hypothetical protein [Terriglobia bacterium]